MERDPSFHQVDDGRQDSPVTMYDPWLHPRGDAGRSDDSTRPPPAAGNLLHDLRAHYIDSRYSGAIRPPRGHSEREPPVHLAAIFWLQEEGSEREISVHPVDNGMQDSPVATYKSEVRFGAHQYEATL